MYKLQYGNRWETYPGTITDITDSSLIVEDGGIARIIPIASVQGWVYDPTPARDLTAIEAPVISDEDATL